MATPECEEIEKCIKDLLKFPNNSPILPIGPKIESSLKSELFDNRCLVTNIEEQSLLQKTVLAPPIVAQSSVSELIDVNVLTDFASKHIKDSHFDAADLVLNSKDHFLPHPELEDNCPTVRDEPKSISDILSNISKEIQNSPNFLSMPGNPLYKTPFSPENTVSNGASSFDYKSNDYFDNVKKKGRERKKKKTRPKKKEKDQTRPKEVGEFDGTDVSNISEASQQGVADLKKSETQPSPSKKKKIKKDESEIKLKRGVFSVLCTVGREYALSFPQDSVQCRFQCNICSYSTDLTEHVTNHLKSRNHKKMKEQNDLDMMLPFLPEPLTGQTGSISELLISLAEAHGFSDEDLCIRKVLADRVTKFVEEHVPSCSVDLIGSSATGIGLKGSAVDFLLKVTSEDDVPDNLEALYAAFSEDEAYIKVSSNFKKKRPSFSFTDKETNLSCNISWDNSSTTKFAKLISIYTKLDKRVKTLGTVFRYWAKLCKIDHQDDGTLPSFSFVIILIYFLQQVQPAVLPVLQEMDEYTRNDFYESYVLGNKWCSQNCDSLGALWIKLFEFYNFNFKMGQDVICIRSSKRVTCTDRHWSTKFYAIEDPFARRNLGYVIPTYQVCHYIQNCFTTTLRYFAYPQLKDGYVKAIKNEAFDSTMLSEYVSSKFAMKEELSGESEASETEEMILEDHDPEITIDELVSTMTNVSMNENELNASEPEASEKFSKMDDTSSKTSPSFEKEDSEKVQKLFKSVDKAIQPVMCSWDIDDKNLSIDSFHYEFNVKTLAGDKSVPLICRSCKSTGHSKKDCPSEELPPPCALPEMTPQFQSIIKRVLFYVRDKYKITDVEVNHTKDIMLDIQNSIRKVFPDATLSMFGSFCNGFGFKNRSDMDFCLTFGEKDDKENIDPREIIEKTAKILTDHPNLENIVSVTSAKVPIVKFSCADTKIEGDISLYNTLALANTEMLEAYSKIDDRVQILGFAFKYFAKILGIGDASRGSLSSYAYILMVIFFLQQRNPPVIPVLQELHEKEKPSKLVDCWNVWWYKDLDKLSTVWPDYQKNKESPDELWLGLFSFYSCEFDWKEFVVSIKQRKPLTRFKKLWFTDTIAIEDPFELKHNLGSGLSRKMNSYIFKAFLRARERFGTPVLPQRLNDIRGIEVAYLFDRRFLSSGTDPPIDRGCRKCGKLGHFAKDCSQNKCCSWCQKTGHLVKNCPNKTRNRRPRDNEKSNSNDTVPIFNEIEKQLKIRNVESTIKKFPPLQHPAPSAIDRIEGTRNLFTGVPPHRFPPGFNSGASFMPNPPPGFKSRMPSPQNSYPPYNNPHHPPFPRSLNEVNSSSPPKYYNMSPPKSLGHNSSKYFGQSPPKHYSQSPPKPFSSSPPKHFPGNKTQFSFHDPPWDRQGLQVERHPVPERQRQNRMHIQQNLHPMSNPLQRHDVRHKRANTDNNSYYSNHGDRW